MAAHFPHVRDEIAKAQLDLMSKLIQQIVQYLEDLEKENNIDSKGMNNFYKLKLES